MAKVNYRDSIEEAILQFKNGQMIIVVDDKDDTESSTYFLLANCPSALGADVVPPVIVLADADIVMSPHERPVFTLKLRVVMVPISPA